MDPSPAASSQSLGSRRWTRLNEMNNNNSININIKIFVDDDNNNNKRREQTVYEIIEMLME